MTDRPAFVGRRDELAVLRRAVDAAAAGGSAVAGLRGEPGIGKSSLLDAAAEVAVQRGLRVVRGQATEFERDWPWALFGAALAELLPGTGPVERGDRLAHFRSLRRRLAEIACTSPTTLVLDDVHWADETSLEFLDHLLRHPVEAGLTVLFAYRPRQAPVRLAAAVGRARQQHAATVLDLSGLSVADLAALAPDRLDRPAVSQHHRACQGNPLYFQLAIAHGGDPEDRSGPLLIDAQLSTVPATAVRLLQAAAVVGDPFDVRFAVTVAGGDWDDAQDRPQWAVALADLVDRDLIRETGRAQHFRFRHGLIRHHAHTGADPAWRVDAHATAAAELRRTGGDPARIAHHLVHCARPGDLAAADQLAAAAATVASSAPVTAVEWYRAALDVLDGTAAAAARRVRWLGELATALARAGRLREASDTARAVLDTVDERRLTERSPLVCACAEADLAAGDHHRARALLTSELARHHDHGSRAAVGLLLSRAVCDVVTGEFAAASASAREVVAVLDRLTASDALGLSAWSTLAMSAATTGRTEAAHDAADRAVALLDRMSDRDVAAALLPAATLVWALYYLDRLPDGLRVAARGAEVARHAGILHLLATLLSCTGEINQALGRLTDAAKAAAHASDVAHLVGSAEQHALALATAAEAALWLDPAPERAHALALQAVAAAGPVPGIGGRKATFILAETALATGCPGDIADRLVAEGGGPELPAWPLPPQPRVLETLTRLALAAGELDRAADFAARAAAVSTHGSAASAAHAHRAKARVHAAQSNRNAVVSALTAADGFRQAGLPLEEARTRLLAATSTSGDQRSAALARAGRLAAMLGSGRLTGLVRRAGGHADEPILTRREREVMDLLVRGLSNRHIAERLTISVRTAESHVANILQKVNVPSRAALAARYSPRSATEHGEDVHTCHG